MYKCVMSKYIIYILLAVIGFFIISEAGYEEQEDRCGHEVKRFWE